MKRNVPKSKLGILYSLGSAPCKRPAKDWTPPAMGVIAGGLEQYGRDAVTNGPPYEIGRPNVIKYAFAANSNTNQILWIKFAAMVSRPCYLSWTTVPPGGKGTVVTPIGHKLGGITGDWNLDKKAPGVNWERIGDVLARKDNVNWLEINRADVIPHIYWLYLTPDPSDSPNF